MVSLTVTPVLPVVLLLFLPFIHFSSAAEVMKRPTKIIDSVCKQVSNYTFCVEAIYSDFRAPEADAVGLAQVTYFLAYNQVANTSTQITLLRNSPEVRKDSHLVKALLHCRANYREADKYILGAFDLIDSEIYWTLKDLMTKVANAAADCEKGFKKLGKASLLTQRNKVLEDICEMCIVVANLLNTT